MAARIGKITTGSAAMPIQWLSAKILVLAWSRAAGMTWARSASRISLIFAVSSVGFSLSTIWRPRRVSSIAKSFQMPALGQCAKVYCGSMRPEVRVSASVRFAFLTRIFHR